MKIHRDLDLTPSNKELSDSGYIVKVGQTEFTDRRDVRNENQGCLQPFDMSIQTDGIPITEKGNAAKGRRNMRKAQKLNQGI